MILLSVLSIRLFSHHGGTFGLRRRLATLVMIVLGFVCLLGCHSIATPFHGLPSTPEPPKKRLGPPPPRVAANSVGLDVAVVEIPADDWERFEQAWQDLDQLSPPLATRQRLLENALRLAVGNTQLPSSLSEILDPPPLEIPDLSEEAAQNLANRLRYVEKRHLQISPKKTFWVGCSPPFNSLDWQFVAMGERRSGQCEQAQIGWVMEIEPRGDGSLLLSGHGEIRHGEKRKRYVLDEDSFHFDERQNHLRIQELAFEQPLRLGEHLLLAPILDEDGNHLFLSRRRGKRRFYRFVIIRVAQTQHDDLFRPLHPTL